MLRVIPFCERSIIMKKIGLYIHIPFCAAKCPYCDFYSVGCSKSSLDEYTTILIDRINFYDGQYLADTVYIGGGTPSLLGTERLLSVLTAVNSAFGTVSRETTIEVNPRSAKLLDFFKLKQYGIDRVSIGLQSANEKELKALGRRHNADDVKQAVELIRDSGIDNISLDLMLGIPYQTQDSLSDSIKFCSELDVKHISAYILKIEEGTPYYKAQNSLDLPDEDVVCDLYEYAVDRLSAVGYKQYEISNFSKSGFESKHNLKYWHCEEYLGIGPAAHSFIDKKRFYYNRSIEDFRRGIIIDDGIGGEFEEYIAMALRLCEGLKYSSFEEYFNMPFPEKYKAKAQRLVKTGLLSVDDTGIRLNPKGFLCSNTIISDILY